MDTLIALLAGVWGISVVSSALLLIVGSFAFGDHLKEAKRRRLVYNEEIEPFLTKGVIITAIIASAILASPNLIEFTGSDHLVFNKQGEYLRTVDGPRFWLQSEYDKLLAENDVRSAEIGRDAMYLAFEKKTNYFLKVEFRCNREKVSEIIKKATSLGIEKYGEADVLIRREVESLPEFKEALSKAISMNLPRAEYHDRPGLEEAEASALFIPAVKIAQKRLEPLGIKLFPPKFWISRK